MKPGIEWSDDPEERERQLKAIDATKLVAVRAEYTRLRRDWHNAPYGLPRYAIFRRMVDLLVEGYELAQKWHDIPANPAEAVRRDLLAFGLKLYAERRAALHPDQVGPAKGEGDGQDV